MIEGIKFDGWGAHTSKPFSAYVTAAAAIGKPEMCSMSVFVERTCSINLFVFSLTYSVRDLIVNNKEIKMKYIFIVFGTYFF